MKQLVPMVFTLLILFSPACPSFSQETKADITAKVEVDRAFATIGDRINFRITVKHAPEISVLDLRAEDVLKDFEIKEATPFSAKEGKGISEGKNYVITTYQLGEYVIQPFAIQFRARDGKTEELKTNSLYVTIESVDKKKDPESDIRGIKGVFRIRSRAWIWFIFVLCASGIAVGAVLYFRQRKEIQSATVEMALSPHDEAYQALNRLRHSDFIRKGQVKLYFFQMSEILRRYFERRYQIRALESTTNEVLQELKRLESLENMTLVRDILSFCDLAKFAKYEPPAAEILQTSNQARQIIDQTKQLTEEQTVQPPKVE